MPAAVSLTYNLLENVLLFKNKFQHIVVVKWTCIICMHSKLFSRLLIKALFCESQVVNRVVLAGFLSLEKYYGIFSQVSKGETEAAHVDRVFMGGQWDLQN